MSMINSDGSINAPSKLDLVNMCLRAIGETALPAGTVLDTLPAGTDSSDASEAVDEVALEVLKRGWWFNQEHNYKFMPDGDNFIALPPTVLKVDFGTTQNRGNIIKKGNKLYNLTEQSFQFTDPVYGSVVWFVNFADMPLSVFFYIGVRAARKFQQRSIGSNDLFQFTLVDEQDAFIELQREQAQVQDYNLIDSRMLNRYANPNWTNIK